MDRNVRGVVSVVGCGCRMVGVVRVRFCGMCVCVVAGGCPRASCSHSSCVVCRVGIATIAVYVDGVWRWVTAVCRRDDVFLVVRDVL